MKNNLKARQNLLKIKQDGAFQHPTDFGKAKDPVNIRFHAAAAKNDQESAKFFATEITAIHNKIGKKIICILIFNFTANLL